MPTRTANALKPTINRSELVSNIAPPAIPNKPMRTAKIPSTVTPFGFNGLDCIDSAATPVHIKLYRKFRYSFAFLREGLTQQPLFSFRPPMRKRCKR